MGKGLNVCIWMINFLSTFLTGLATHIDLDSVPTAIIENFFRATEREGKGEGEGEERRKSRIVQSANEREKFVVAFWSIYACLAFLKVWLLVYY